MDPKERFGTRASDYARYRPSYPKDVVTLLCSTCGLGPSKRVADIGSGTGLFSRLLLESEATVFGVEPNPEMREKAESDLAHESRFNSVVGSAEDIPLGDQSVDLVSAAQSYHWFETSKTREEFHRILKPPGWVVLLWNIRKVDSTEFHKDYENLLSQWGIEYKGPLHGHDDLSPIRRMFTSGQFQHHTFHNPQFLFWEELQGRAQSASYFPLPDHENHAPAIQGLREIFDKHKVGGRVNFDYSTEVFLGTIKD